MTIEEIKQLVNQKIIENYTGDITAEDVNRILNETLDKVGGQETKVNQLALKMVENGDSEEISNLDIADEEENVIARFKDGEVETQKFRSTETPKVIDIDGYDVPFTICDDKGNIIATFPKGFDSSKLGSNINPEVLQPKRYIKVLCFGHSYMGDAISYVPYILTEILGEEADLHIAFAYKANCSIREHYDYSQNGNPYPEFFEFKTSNGKWRKSTTTNFENAINLDNWDIVTMQTSVGDARDYTEYQPYLNEFIKVVRSKVNTSIKIGWNALRTTNADVATEITNYESIQASTQRLLNETIVDFIIPNGTAIENARTTSLVNLPTDDIRMTQDSAYHLQEGIPRLVEAYTMALKILHLYGFENKSIVGSKFNPTPEWVSKNTIQKQGNSVGTDSDTNLYLAQCSAIMANKKPFEITDCGTLFE